MGFVKTEVPMTVDIIFCFFNQPPSSVVIFYVLNMDLYGKFLTRYPPSVVYITVGLNLQETLLKKWPQNTIIFLIPFNPQAKFF